MDSTAQPSWVYKRDGRLVPFETDKISQALFAAAEALGRPDAFLCRELTDGILHFLEKETAGATPSTTEVAELVVKVVRELGQPALAHAYAEGNRRRLRSRAHSESTVAGPGSDEAAGAMAVLRFRPADSPAAVVRQCLREYSLQGIFARDLVAAHREGLLTLFGLEAPLELAGAVFDMTGRAPERGRAEALSWSHSRRSGALVQAILEMRARAGAFLVVDGPEYTLTPFASAGDLAKNSGELSAGLEATGLAAIVNLNCAQPPGWAEENVEGPLFAEARRSSPVAHVDEYRSVLLEHLLRPALAERVRIDWHLGASDFQKSDEQVDARLLRLARLAMESPALSFTFDRPAGPLALAEGIDREHPAILAAVGLNLPRLAALADVKGEPERFLLKLANLARMAVSAAAQKRDFLRRRGSAQDLARGFLLDRARLNVVPIGLQAVVREFTGQDLTSSHAASAFAQQLVSSLCANLRQASYTANLDACVDGACWSGVDQSRGFSAAQETSAETALPELADVAGLTCWAPAAEPRDQLSAAGLLHSAADSGTAAVLIPQDQAPSPDEVIRLLYFAWLRTGVVRLRFVRVPHQQKQLPW